MQDFTKLAVWERAQSMAARIYQLTDGIAVGKYPGLRSQLRRASASIGANIAEGCGASSRPQFARYLQLAIGSASEVQSHLSLAKKLALVAAPAHDELAAEVIAIRRMLVVLRRRVLEGGGG